MSGGFWATLGIERTEDVAAIRRGYARRLKAIDVDADPAAFIALREALERALAHTAARRRGVEELPSPEGRLEAWDEALDEELDRELTAEDLPDVPPSPDNARFAALDGLLFAPAGEGEEGWRHPDPDALVAAVAEILDHPDMAAIDHSARVEGWLAQILWEAVPRSDPAIGIVVDRFGWEARAGAWDQPWLFEALVQRRQGIRFIDELSMPGHPLHHAWRDLTSDEPRLGFTTVARSNGVGALLGQIREACPSAEEALNAHRVALWDEKLSRSVEGGLKWAGLVAVGLFFLVHIVSALSHGTPPSASASQVATEIGQLPGAFYADPALDLAPYVERASLGRLKVADIASRQPRLYALLIARWEQSSARRQLDPTFAGDVQNLLDAAALEGLRGGSYDLQADYWRLHLDRLKWLQSRDPEACDRYLRGETVRYFFPAAHQERLRELKARALETEVAPREHAAAAHYQVPGTVLEAAARRAGVAPRELSSAIAGGGTPTRRCAAEIALLEALLAAPRREAEPMLWAMSATI